MLCNPFHRFGPFCLPCYCYPTPLVWWCQQSISVCRLKGIGTLREVLSHKEFRRLAVLLPGTRAVCLSDHALSSSGGILVKDKLDTLAAGDSHQVSSRGAIAEVLDADRADATLYAFLGCELAPTLRTSTAREQQDELLCLFEVHLAPNSGNFLDQAWYEFVLAIGTATGQGQPFAGNAIDPELAIRASLVLLAGNYCYDAPIRHHVNAIVLRCDASYWSLLNL